MGGASVHTSPLHCPRLSSSGVVHHPPVQCLVHWRTPPSTCTLNLCSPSLAQGLPFTRTLTQASIHSLQHQILKGYGPCTQNTTLSTGSRLASEEHRRAERCVRTTRVWTPNLLGSCSGVGSNDSIFRLSNLSSLLLWWG